MFRQFSIDEKDRDWLRLVWRDSPEEELQSFRMCTVVYGTASAPFEAIRSMQQLAHDEHQNFPKAAEILKDKVYMDDILAGADTVEEAIVARDELIGI